MRSKMETTEKNLDREKNEKMQELKKLKWRNQDLENQYKQ